MGSTMKRLVAGALFAGAMGTATVVAHEASADAGEKAIKARHGFMQTVVWEAGPLFGMAKGEVAYDADIASGHAEALQALSGYDYIRLFPEGTAKPDRTGKTRALPAIWEDMAGFRAANDAFAEAAANLAAEAGNGADALKAAVQQLGKSCGNCHDDYRADEF